MKQLNIHEAKAKLSSLVDQAARGKSIIAKSGTPLARLGPIHEPPRTDAGITAEGFDERHRSGLLSLKI